MFIEISKRNRNHYFISQFEDSPHDYYQLSYSLLIEIMRRNIISKINIDNSGVYLKNINNENIKNYAKISYLRNISNIIINKRRILINRIPKLSNFSIII